MTDHRCIHAEEAAAILELPADDPRRHRAERCPACRAILAGYRAFLAEPSEPVPGEDAAGVRLRAHVRDLVRGPAREPSASPMVRLRQLWRRPLLAAAAATAVVALTWIAFDARRPGDVPRLRGTETSTPLAVDVRHEGSDLVVAWTVSNACDAWSVVLLDDTLGEVARRGPFGAPPVRIGPDALPERAAYVVVEGLSQGDVVVRSAPIPLR